MEAAIGLGANIGDRRSTIETAVKMLSELAQIDVVKVSTLRETEPVGVTDQPDFLNGVVVLATNMDPRDLMSECMRIEKCLGRKRKERWGPRTIDLDLLLYGSDIIEEPGMTVPHPRMAERAFVLEPLAEVLPDWRHPILGRTAWSLWESFGRTARMDK